MKSLPRTIIFPAVLGALMFSGTSMSSAQTTQDSGQISELLSEAKGHELRNCPRYVREWVNREIATKTSIRRNPVTDDSPDTQVCLELQK